jgi:hypothetical protein
MTIPRQNHKRRANQRPLILKDAQRGPASREHVTRKGLVPERGWAENTLSSLAGEIPHVMPHVVLNYSPHALP